jgi:hypothetical protein
MSNKIKLETSLSLPYPHSDGEMVAFLNGLVAEHLTMGWKFTYIDRTRDTRKIYFHLVRWTEEDVDNE